MDRIIVHIGLHKTGTTFLQTQLFPNLTNCKVVRGFHSHRVLLNEYLDKHIILSDEGLSGNLWNGTYSNDFTRNIKRIKTMYNRPKIVLGIRGQESWIPSLYKQYLHEKGFESIDYLYNIKNTGRIKHEELKLRPKIELLKENFDDLFIYDQESLFKHSESFIEAFVNFIGDQSVEYKEIGKLKRENVGVRTNFQVYCLKRFNSLNKLLEKISPKLSMYSPVLKYAHLSPRDLCQNVLGVIPSVKFELNEDLMNFIKDYYKEDWEQAASHVSY